MPVPSLTGSDKLPGTALRATAGEGYFVSAKSKNPQGGLEYMRQMLSKAGRARASPRWSRPRPWSPPAAEGFAFPPGVASSQAALAAAGKDVFNLYFDGWYKELDTEARTATNELMFGRIKADAFVERIQKRADAIKKDCSDHQVQALTDRSSGIMRHGKYPFVIGFLVAPVDALRGLRHLRRTRRRSRSR